MHDRERPDGPAAVLRLPRGVAQLELLAGRPAPRWAASQIALVDQVLASTARRHGLEPETVRRANTGPAVRARHEWLVLVRDTWALSASDTARLCGVNHTTVLAALRRVPRDE